MDFVFVVLFFCLRLCVCEELKKSFSKRGFWIEESELQILRPIGKGAAGSTYLGRYRDQDVAVKDYEEDVLTNDSNSVLNELIFMADLEHENIVPFVGIVVKRHPDKVLLVSKYAKNGDLTHAIHTKKIFETMSLEDKVKMALGIARG